MLSFGGKNFSFKPFKLFYSSYFLIRSERVWGGPDPPDPPPPPRHCMLEHCSANAAATGSNLVEAPKLFFGLNIIFHCLPPISSKVQHSSGGANRRAFELFEFGLFKFPPPLGQKVDQIHPNVRFYGQMPLPKTNVLHFFLHMALF